MVTALIFPFTNSLATEQQASPRAVVEQLYSYFESGDMEKILSLLDDDVVFHLHGPAHQLPWAGVYKGHAGVGEFFQNIMKTAIISRVTHDQFIVDGDRVNVIGRDIGSMRASGGAFDAAHLHSWQVKNGKIIRLQEITDTAELINALAPADAERGRAYFTTCAGCHGPHAEGNPAMHAPGLTLQDRDYLLRQLRHFRSGVRGGVTDFYGWQMNGRAAALPDDRALRDVLAFIDTQTDSYAKDTLGGNTRKGRKLYERHCLSCHGEKAEGNSSLQSPRLAGLEGWYQLEQLKKFRSGLRGAQQSDIAGQSMRAALSPLKDEKTLIDIIDYITTLQ